MPSSLDTAPRPLELLRAEFRSIIDLIDSCGLTDPAPGAPECATSATAGMSDFAPAIRAVARASSPAPRRAGGDACPTSAPSATHSSGGGPR